ncbi:hypothetical protein GEMRC1_006648 [Eukaryota sp. GEM-RC1]
MPNPRRKDLVHTNAQYKALLEERNKLFQRMEAKKHSKGTIASKKRELQPKNFDLYFGGANASRTTAQSTFTSPEPPSEQETRSKWGNLPKQSLVIKTSDGDAVKVTPRGNDSLFDPEQAPNQSNPLLDDVISRLHNLSEAQLQDVRSFISSLTHSDHEESDHFMDDNPADSSLPPASPLSPRPSLDDSPTLDNSPSYYPSSDFEQDDSVLIDESITEEISPSFQSDDVTQSFSIKEDSLFRSPTPNSINPFGKMLAQAVRSASRGGTRKVVEVKQPRVDDVTDDVDEDRAVSKVPVTNKWNQEASKRPIWLESLVSVRDSVEFELKKMDQEEKVEENSVIEEEKKEKESESSIENELIQSFKQSVTFDDVVIDTRQSMDMTLSRAIFDSMPAISSRSSSALSSVDLPLLPVGNVITFHLLSTWGDDNWIGLAGIEVFDKFGKKIVIDSIDADPFCVSESDPRKPINLIDDCPRTTSIYHQWLAPFTGTNKIFITFKQDFDISLVRIWNYNSSRIHSTRGVRGLKILLNEELIFSGEVTQGEGKIEGAKELAEVILLTKNPDIIQLLAENDPVPDFEVPISRAQSKRSPSKSRPITHQILSRSQASTPRKTVDPETVQSQSHSINNQTKAIISSWLSSISNHSLVVETSSLMFYLTQNYGDSNYIGLTTLIPIIKTKDSVALLNPNNIEICINPSLERFVDHRSPKNLKNLTSTTTNDNKMWLSRRLHSNNEVNYLLMKFSSSFPVIGFLVYGYNKSADDVCRSVKNMVIVDDKDRLVSPRRWFSNS